VKRFDFGSRAAGGLDFGAGLFIPAEATSTDDPEGRVCRAGGRRPGTSADGCCGTMRTTTTMLVSIEAQRSSDQPMSSFVANEASHAQFVPCDASAGLTRPSLSAWS